jgi:hypothetical protein
MTFVFTPWWWLRVSAETCWNKYYSFIVINTSAISWNKSYLYYVIFIRLLGVKTYEFMNFQHKLSTQRDAYHPWKDQVVAAWWSGRGRNGRTATCSCHAGIWGGIIVASVWGSSFPTGQQEAAAPNSRVDIILKKIQIGTCRSVNHVTTTVQV